MEEGAGKGGAISGTEMMDELVLESISYLINEVRNDFYFALLSESGEKDNYCYRQKRLREQSDTIRAKRCR